MLSFTESNLSDTDNTALFENTNTITLINLLCVLLYITGAVFSNGAMLSMSDKYDSVNERTQDIIESMKLHILGVWQNANKIYQATG